MLRIQDLRPSTLRHFGSAAAMAEMAELYFGRLEEMIGSPITGRDPMHPTFVPISDAPEPYVRPGDAEDAMIARIDASRQPVLVRPRRRR